jgi:hypothetical protein
MGRGVLQYISAEIYRPARAIKFNPQTDVLDGARVCENGANSKALPRIDI